MAAQVSGTVDLSGLLPASVQISGDFELSINRTDAAVDEIVTVGDDEIVLDLVAGPYLRVAATDVVLSIAGQTLTGDVAFEQGGHQRPRRRRHRARRHQPVARAWAGEWSPDRRPRRLRLRRHRRHAGSIAGTVVLDVARGGVHRHPRRWRSTPAPAADVPEIEHGGVTLDARRDRARSRHHRRRRQPRRRGPADPRQLRLPPDRHRRRPRGDPDDQRSQRLLRRRQRHPRHRHRRRRHGADAAAAT